MPKLRVLFIVVLLVFVAVSCRTPGGRTAGEVIDDSSITTKVKTKIYGEGIMEGLAISVKTFQGNVTLSGGVDNAEQKAKAEELAAGVYGVKKVNNLLLIKKK